MEVVKKIGKSFASAIVSHFNALLIKQLDPVYDLNSNLPNDSFNGSLNPQFMFPVIIIIIACLYGTFGLEYESTGSLVSFTTSPYIFIHQMFPSQVWLFTDLECCVVSAYAASVFLANSVLNSQIDPKYRIIYDGQRLLMNSKILTREVSRKIMIFRKTSKTIFFILLTIYTIVAYSYFYTMVWLNAAFTLKIGSLIFWFVIYPMFMFYCIFGFFGFAVYLIITSRYLELYQLYILKRMVNINAKLCSRKRRIPYFWFKFVRANRSIVHICATINSYSHYWSPYLSLTLPCSIFVSGYLLYLNFIVGSIPLLEKTFFVSASSFVSLFLFLLINRCARVLKCNQAIQRQNRLFFIRFQQYRFRIHERQLLMAEQFQLSNRLDRYAFRLFGNYRITSNTFDMIISYISIFFMLIIKNPYIMPE